LIVHISSAALSFLAARDKDINGGTFQFHTSSFLVRLPMNRWHSSQIVLIFISDTCASPNPMQCPCTPARVRMPFSQTLPVQLHFELPISKKADPNPKPALTSDPPKPLPITSSAPLPTPRLCRRQPPSPILIFRRPSQRSLSIPSCTLPTHQQLAHRILLLRRF
jgi:hypothetical protein